MKLLPSSPQRLNYFFILLIGLCVLIAHFSAYYVIHSFYAREQCEVCPTCLDISPLASFMSSIPAVLGAAAALFGLMMLILVPEKRRKKK